MTLPFPIECGDGWWPLVADLWSAIGVACDRLSVPLPKVLQCKEKFGGLRFYVTSTHRDVIALIGEAEAASYYVCELCGDDGRLRGGPMLSTRCDVCVADRVAAYVLGKK